MFLRIIICLAMLASVVAMPAQRTTRKGLKVDQKQQIINGSAAAAAVDTIYIAADAPTDKLAPLYPSGYEKTLRSRKESFLITNNTKDTVNGVTFDITYYDMNRRQVHKRTVSAKCNIPPGETRMVEFKSWDAQLVWYYYLSDKPRTRGQATPYKVVIEMKSYVTPHQDRGKAPRRAQKR